MKRIEAHGSNLKMGTQGLQAFAGQPPTANREVGTHHSIHEFRWTETKQGGTATCTCGRWQLYGLRSKSLTKDTAKRSYILHRANLPQAVGHEGPPQRESDRESPKAPKRVLRADANRLKALSQMEKR